MSSSTLPNPHLSDGEILHIFVEVSNGRGRQGDFLRSLANAIVHADTANFELIKDAACSVIEKYDLRRYLDTYGGEAATA